MHQYHVTYVFALYENDKHFRRKKKLYFTQYLKTIYSVKFVHFCIIKKNLY